MENSISLIGRAIEDISLESIPKSVVYLNLHSNEISDAEPLRQFTSLRHVDLSSNLISSIPADLFSCLPQLVSLSLASNNLQRLENLDGIFNLRYLDLSFNQISNLSGLLVFSAPYFKLERLDLQENCLDDVDHVINCLRSIKSLRHVHLGKGSDWRKLILAECAQLLSCDGLDRNGVAVPSDQHPFPLADLSNMAVSQERPGPLPPSPPRPPPKKETPLIDQALNAFRASSSIRFATPLTTTTTTTTTTPSPDDLNTTSSTVEASPPTKEAAGSRRVRRSATAASPVDENSENVPPTASFAHRSQDDLLYANLQRANIKQAYDSIIQDLQAEKGRRIKAEQAFVRLTTEYEKLNRKTMDFENGQQMANLKSDELGRQLEQTQSTLKTTQVENQSLNERVVVLQNETSQLREYNEKLQKQVADLQQSNGEVVRDKTILAKQLTELQLKVGALRKECEILNGQKQNLTGKLERLEEKGQDTDSQLEKLDKDWRIKYADLEEEFREALRIEAARFDKLKTAFEQRAHNLREARTALLELRERDTKNAGLLLEQSNVIKEQNAKLLAVTAAKDEIKTVLSERCAAAEGRLRECCEKLLEMEGVKKRNGELLAQMKAQKDQLAALREETLIWRRQLSAKETQLAADRGAVDSKLETLRLERDTARKERDSALEAERSKADAIAKQTGIINQLKSALLERDRLIQLARDEVADVKSKMGQSEQEVKEREQQLLDEVDRLNNRKEQLKEELDELRQENGQLSKHNDRLNDDWKRQNAELQKVVQLNDRVKSIEAEYKGKLADLTESRQQTELERKRLAEALQSVDDRFRQQLDLTETAHQRRLNEVRREHEAALRRSAARVEQVEAEMRQLLEERQRERDDVDRQRAALVDLARRFGHDRRDVDDGR